MYEQWMNFMFIRPGGQAAGTSRGQLNRRGLLGGAVWLGGTTPRRIASRR